MHHAAIVSKNVQSYVILRTNNDSPADPVFYEYLDDGTFQEKQLSYTVNQISSDLYRADFTTPDYDSYLCLLWDSFSMVLRVGNPGYRAFIFTGETGKSIQYERLSITDGSVINTGTAEEHGFGFYSIPLTTINSVIRFDNGVVETFKIPYKGETAGTSFRGTIEIEPGWQMISIPVQYGYFDKTSGTLVHDGTTVARIKNYVMDQIEYITGLPAQSVITAANTYVGDNQFFYNYVPGVTDENSDHNFPLVYFDDNKQSLEVTAFFIHNKLEAKIIIQWGE